MRGQRDGEATAGAAPVESNPATSGACAEDIHSVHRHTAKKVARAFKCQADRADGVPLCVNVKGLGVIDVLGEDHAEVQRLRRGMAGGVGSGGTKGRACATPARRGKEHVCTASPLAAPGAVPVTRHVVPTNPPWNMSCSCSGAAGAASRISINCGRPCDGRACGGREDFCI